MTSGILAQHPIPGSAAVSVVNSGVEAFVRAASLELPRGLRVNVVRPPWVSETLVSMGRDPAGGLPASETAVRHLDGRITASRRSGSRRPGRIVPLMRILVDRIARVIALSLFSACAGRAPAIPATDNAPPPTVAARQRAVVRLRVAGAPADRWHDFIEVLTDSLYHYSSGSVEQQYMSLFSLTEGKTLRVGMEPIGTDSTGVTLTGQTYVGRADRPGVILAAGSAWPNIFIGDSAEATLTNAAARLVAGLGRSDSGTAQTPDGGGFVADVGMSRDSLLRDLPDGRKAYCKANHLRRDRLLIVDNVNMADWCRLSAQDAKRNAYNTYVLQDPAATPPGQELEICTISGYPGGFTLVEWFTDSTRCPYDPHWEWKREPNMMRIRRER